MKRVRNLFRHKVSKENRRWIDEEFDLDLSYITDRLIAMGFPSTGIESNYRNPRDDVSAFLQRRHANHFKVINLSERKYSDRVFEGPVAFLPFPDHHAPPYPRLLEAVKIIHEWLEADPANVAAVHCLAGHGRTGIVIATCLLFEGFQRTAADALREFALRRSRSCDGVSYPSQQRYVQYAAEHLTTAQRLGRDIFVCLPQRTIRLTTVHFHNIWATGKPFKYVVAVFDVHVDPIYSTAWAESPIIDRTNTAQFWLNFVVKGDFTIKLFTAASKPNEVARITLNTRFMRGGEIQLKKEEIDGPHRDSNKGHRPDMLACVKFEGIETDEDVPEVITTEAVDVMVPDGESSREEDDGDPPEDMS